MSGCLLLFQINPEGNFCMRLKKWNRRGKLTLRPRNPDAPGYPRRAVVHYDGRSKAKKPPAWMLELLFSDNTV